MKMIEHIYWLGDSTVHFNRIDTWPQCGMGQELELYLRDGVTVHDHGENGCSTKSYWERGFFEPVRAALRPGDLVLIQFGHNDNKPEDPARYTTAEEYQGYLMRYIRAAREAGALPVLITPLTRRRYADGVLTVSHGPYPDAMRELARREDVPLIDLTVKSRKLVEELGDPANKAFYMHLEPGVYPNYPEGKADDTHLRYLGAVRFAGLVAQGLRELGGAYAQILLE